MILSKPTRAKYAKKRASMSGSLVHTAESWWLTDRPSGDWARPLLQAQGQLGRAGAMISDNDIHALERLHCYTGFTTDRPANLAKGTYLPIYVAWECDVAAHWRARTHDGGASARAGGSHGADLGSGRTRRAGRTEARHLAPGPEVCIGPAYPAVREVLEDGCSRLRREHTPHKAVGGERRGGLEDPTDPEPSPISQRGGSSQSATA
eukprot:6178652-Pleurochrysis_carterae.AAC.6